jgi:hypothetical protein
MFTWICPQCGREVPPSYSECPTCAERRQQGAQPAPPQPAPPQQPQYTPPPPQYTPQPPVYAPPPQQTAQFAPPPQPAAPPPQYIPPQQQYAPPPQQPQPMYVLEEQKKGMPTWLVGLLTIAVLGGALFGLYKYVGKGGGTTTSAPPRSEADSKAAAGHPYRKYVEIVGLRILENSARKPIVRYTVVNHSPAELQGLELELTLTSTNGGEPLSIIKAKVGRVDAYAIKDMESPLETKLKIYELPDWQFVKATFEITAPK